MLSNILHWFTEGSPMQCPVVVDHKETMLRDGGERILKKIRNFSNIFNVIFKIHMIFACDLTLHLYLL